MEYKDASKIRESSLSDLVAAKLLSDESIGSALKARLKKSRFGTEGRECTFKIVWGGDDIAIQDEESWLEAIKTSDQLEQGGAWFSLVYADGTKEKFQSAMWMEKLQNPKFRERVLQIMDKEIITNFETKEGNASNYYNIDGDEPSHVGD